MMPDTNKYLLDALNPSLLPPRPPWYGFLLWSWALPYWWWVLAALQVGLVAWLGVRSVAAVCAEERAAGSAGAFSLLVIGVTTAASCDLTRLVPDFLAPALFLAALVILYGSRPIERVVATGVVGASVLAHASHFANAALLALLVAALWGMGRMRGARTRWLLSALVAALIAVPTSNWLRYGQFRVSFSTGPFLANRLNELGLLDRYLEETCGDSKERLCAYRGDLGSVLGFLFKGKRDRSIVEAVGGWSGDGYLDQVAAEVTRKYPLEFAWGTLVTVAHQFFSFAPRASSRAGHERDLLRKTGTAAKDFQEAAAGRRLVWPTVKIWLYGLQMVCLAVALALAVWLWRFSPPGIRSRIRLVIGLTVGYLLLNAAVCGGLSGVHDRYQARVVWLLPFLTFALSIWVFRQRRALSAPS